MIMIQKYVKRPSLLLLKLIRNLWFLFPDDIYLKIVYRLEMGKSLNLKNPQLYQEKLQWLKLYNKKTHYTSMVDKIIAKEVAAKIIGKQYIIPTLGVWDSFDDINFDSLPNQFVLKTNNGGGNVGVVICKDKTLFDKRKARKILNRSLKFNIYNIYREWPYKNIKPQILAEEFMSDDTEFNKTGLVDYKFTCFNGVADNVMLCLDRNTNDPKFYFYDIDWNLLRLNKRGKDAPKDFYLPKPDCLAEMFKLAGRLSEGIPFLRVDLFYVNGKIYFGEMTFFPASGFDSNILPETEIYFGNKINLNINN